MRLFIRLAARLLFRVRLIGDLSPLMRAPRVLVVANHPAWLDTLLLGLLLPRQPMIVVPPDDDRGQHRRRWLGLVSTTVVDVNNPVAIKRVLRLLKSGRPVVMYPEGRINPGHGALKVYPVPALVALKSGAVVLPVHLEWRRAMPGGWLPPQLTIRVQAPTHVDGGAVRSPRQRRAGATQRLAEILQLMELQARAGKTVFECLLDAIARHGRAWPLIEDQGEEPRSYGFLLKASLAIARWSARHSARGENVGVLLPNVIMSVCTLLGLSAAGRVPAVFNYTAGALGVQSAAVAAGVRTVITSRRFVEQARLQPLLAALDGREILYLEDIRAGFGLLDKLWLMGFALWLPRLAIARQSSTDPLAVLFTSGSEERPKGVVLSHAAVIANVMQMRAVFDFSPDDKILNPLPIYHAYSFTAGMMLPLLTGTRVFLYISPLRYRAIPEIAYRRDCTVLFGTSTFLSYYARHAAPNDFRCMRAVISGGEKLSAEVARLWLEKFGLRIFEGYGSTEAAPVIALATQQAFRRGAVGRFLPGVEHRIEPVEGISDGGVLHIRGPNLMLGYYRYDNPAVIEPPRSAVGEGWYDTGDIVDVDADGLVHIRGRVRRFAKIAGEMVSLDVIEQVARKASPEHQHACILWQQEASGETTVLFSTDAQLSRMQLVEAARTLGVHDLSVARRIVHLAEIPLLANGKTDYVGLRALIDGETLTRLLAAAGRNPDAGRRAPEPPPLTSRK
jgi:acyl-[acyl-carrier-protein]-phospholipid O-acyltransferase / long-chain-fatty-acid--[acyl-carrier-protein] ligase